MVVIQPHSLTVHQPGRGPRQDRLPHHAAIGRVALPIAEVQKSSTKCPGSSGWLASHIDKGITFAKLASMASLSARTFDGVSTWCSTVAPPRKNLVNTESGSSKSVILGMCHSIPLEKNVLPCSTEQLRTVGIGRG